MAKQALKIAPEVGTGADYGGPGLSLYPRLTKDIPAPSSDGRKRILEFLQDENNQEKLQIVFKSELANHFVRVHSSSKMFFVYDDKRKRSPDRVWSEIKSNAGYSVRDAELLPLEEIDDFDRIILNEPWLIHNFVSRACAFPAHYGRRSAHQLFEIEQAFNVNQHGWAFAMRRRPVAYDDVYRYLSSRSDKTGWVEQKYERNFGNRSLEIVVYKDDAKTNLYLIGLDSQTVEEINDGNIKNISINDIKRLGEYVSWCNDSEIYGNYLFQYERIVNEPKLSFDTKLIRFDEFQLLGDYLDKDNLITSDFYIDRDEVVGKRVGRDEVVRLLDRYARENPGAPIGEIALTAVENTLEYESKRAALDEQMRSEHVEESPSHVVSVEGSALVRINKDRPKWKAGEGQTPPEFMMEHYGEELAAGTFTEADLGRADMALRSAFRRYAIAGGEMPDGFIAPRQGNRGRPIVDDDHGKSALRGYWRDRQRTSRTGREPGD